MNDCQEQAFAWSDGTSVPSIERRIPCNSRSTSASVNAGSAWHTNTEKLYSRCADDQEDLDLARQAPGYRPAAPQAVATRQSAPAGQCWGSRK